MLLLAFLVAGEAGIREIHIGPSGGSNYGPEPFSRGFSTSGSVKTETHRTLKSDSSQLQRPREYNTGTWQKVVVRSLAILRTFEDIGRNERCLRQWPGV